MKPPVADPHKVENTEENLKKCICKHCPTFKNNTLVDYPSKGTSSALGDDPRLPHEIKAINCYCLGCELFIKHGLVISHLCVKGNQYL